MTGVAIIGAGHGGFQVAQSLRELGYNAPITLIGDEPGMPYQRPPLSKAYLKDGEEERLWFRQESFFDDVGIDYLAPVRVQSVDTRAGQLTLVDGRTIGFETLVFATGARNRSLPLPGIEHRGVVELRTLADAKALRTEFAKISRAVVIGGGFIGLEFAAVASAAGIAVTVLEATHRVMARVLSEPMSAHFEALHTNSGVDLRLGTMAKSITSADGVHASGVELVDGSVIEGDLVLVAAGVIPNTDLAEAAGISCNNGIVVDGTLQTSVPGIYAIGDCASFVPRGQVGRMRLESVQNAADGARAVAATITGNPKKLDEVPWFWSDQGDAKLQIAGLTQDTDRIEILDRGPGKLAVFCFRDSAFIGVESVNSPGDHMAARRLLALPAALSFDTLSEAAFDLKAVLRESK